MVTHPSIKLKLSIISQISLKRIYWSISKIFHPKCIVTDCGISLYPQNSKSSLKGGKLNISSHHQVTNGEWQAETSVEAIKLLLNKTIQDNTYPYLALFM